jgi:ABC-2 type transport system permease protein
MKKVWMIVRKEWQEMSQQRPLLMSTLVLPVVFAYIAIRTIGITDSSRGLTSLAAGNSALIGLTPQGAVQAAGGEVVRLLFLLLPLLIPGILAAYSIVGEKNNRTLEPLLATPVRVRELLLAKSLAALVPAIVVTWLAAGAYIIALLAQAASPQVVAAVITPGWLIMLLIGAPLMALISVAVTVMISSRVNDPRTAQMITTLVMTPIFLVILMQFVSSLVLSPLLALAVVVVLAAIAAVALWGATKLFQREVILTRWT